MEVMQFMLNMPEVEKAKALMTVAVDWSVMRWLAEKKKVRTAADIANAALDALDREIKSSWSDELKAAYDDLPPIEGSAGPLFIQQKGKEKTISIDPKIKL